MVGIKALTTKLNNLNFNQLEVVSTETDNFIFAQFETKKL